MSLHYHLKLRLTHYTIINKDGFLYSMAFKVCEIILFSMFLFNLGCRLTVPVMNYLFVQRQFVTSEDTYFVN